MKPDAIVILNYPGHLITTLLTLKNIKTLVDWDCPVYFIIDQHSEQFAQWPGNYFGDFQLLVNENFPELEYHIEYFPQELASITDGWFRQQFIKLSIDRLVPGNCWYVTDGDVLANRILDPDEVPYFEFCEQVDNEEEFQIMTANYRRYMLGTDNVILEVNGQAVYTNVIPYRWLTRDLLEGLRATVEEVTGKPFVAHHKELIDDGQIVAGYGKHLEYMIMTEWDLIESYRKNKTTKWTLISPHPFDADYDIGENGFRTFYGMDKDIDRDWLSKQPIQLAPWVFTKIESLSKTDLI